MNSPIPSDPALSALAGPGAAPSGPDAVPGGTNAAPDRSEVRYWTIPEAARELGWPERTLRKRLALENLPVYRPENTKRGILVPDSLLAALRSRPAASGPMPSGSGPVPHRYRGLCRPIRPLAVRCRPVPSKFWRQSWRGR